MSEEPERTALYRIWGEGGALLYIGVSNNFGVRWKTHAKAQPWWPEMRRLTADEWFESRPKAERAEAAAIKAEHPKFNVTHNRPPRQPADDPRRARRDRERQQTGGRLRDLRQSRGISQVTMAAEMTRMGRRWYQATVYKIESGQQTLTFSESVSLAELFGFPSVDALSDVIDPAEDGRSRHAELLAYIANDPLEATAAGCPHHLLVEAGVR